ncbi:hypothetical protein [Actinacidiphila glaucinigra]|uniref:hypothetical protein n=1 Tax=Actinacidiphila glaucinigra TaxID=235986 RepID=UPI0036EC1374
MPRLLPGATASVSELRLTYRTGTALLPRLTETCTRLGFRIREVRADRLPGGTDAAARVLFQVEGTADPRPAGLGTPPARRCRGGRADSVRRGVTACRRGP